MIDQAPVEGRTAALPATEGHVIEAEPGHVLLLYTACVGQRAGREP